MNQVHYYTGIGSRKVPKDIQSKMFSIAVALGEYTENDPMFVLRSGHAEGADLAFEAGCDHVNGMKQILLPWKGFNSSSSTHYEIPEQAFTIAKDVYGPSWNRLKDTTKKFMARNVLQVVGPTLDVYSTLVICWTPDGCFRAEDRTAKTGGTGQAISLADQLGIPIFNLKHDEHHHQLIDFFEQLLLEDIA